MTLQVDYLPIANGSGANVESQAQYELDLGSGGSLQNGFLSGLMKSPQWNKTIRQSSMVAAAVANFISNVLGINVLDDGNLTALTSSFTQAIGAQGQLDYFTGSSAATLAAGFVGRVIINKTVPAATTVVLPPNPNNAAVVGVIDGGDNAAADNITIETSDSSTINGNSTYIIAVNRSWAYFQYVAATTNWVKVG